MERILIKWKRFIILHLLILHGSWAGIKVGNSVNLHLVTRGKPQNIRLPVFILLPFPNTV